MSTGSGNDVDNSYMDIVKVGNEDQPTRSRRITSHLWNFFKPIDSESATCLLCNKNFKRLSLCNLKKHLVAKHPKATKKMDELRRNKVDVLDSKDTIATLIISDELKEPPKSETTEYTINPKDLSHIPRHQGPRKKKSQIWRFFKILDRNYGRCRICHKCVSYKSSISNLKKHVRSKHPKVDYMSATDDYLFPDSPNEGNENDIDDNSFPDDIENVKTLLGLAGTQVDRTIEIIEQEVEDDRDDQMVYEHEDDYAVDYLDDINDNDNTFDPSDDELLIKKTTKPIKKKLSKLLANNVKKETPSPVEIPIVKKEEDAIDILLKNIENKLRKMNAKQQLIAEYKIHEILFLGMSNQLKYGDDDNSCQHVMYTITQNDDSVAAVGENAVVPPL